MKFQVVKVSDYGDYNPEPPDNLYDRLHGDSCFAVPMQSDDKKKVGHLEKIYNAESLTYGKIVMCHSYLDQLEKLLNVEE